MLVNIMVKKKRDGFEDMHTSPVLTVHTVNVEERQLC